MSGCGVGGPIIWQQGLPLLCAAGHGTLRSPFVSSPCSWEDREGLPLSKELPFSRRDIPSREGFQCLNTSSHQLDFPYSRNWKVELCGAKEDRFTRWPFPGVHGGHKVIQPSTPLACKCHDGCKIFVGIWVLWCWCILFWFPLPVANSWHGRLSPGHSRPHPGPTFLQEAKWI